MIKSLIALLAICLAVTGCGTAARNEARNNGTGMQSQQTAPAERNIEAPKDVAAHLEALAMNVPGVNSAHCVIIGNRAVVGVNVDGNVERSRVGTIKYSVAEAFHKDEYGIDAIVTADMDLTERLKEMRDDMVAGRPIAGFAEEMADIIGRIIPLMPRDVQPEETGPDESAAQQEQAQQAPQGRQSGQGNGGAGARSGAAAR